MFHYLWKHKDFIGHVLYDEHSIALHSKYQPDYERGQNAYIPPKLWTLFIKRLDEVLNDFIENQAQIEKAYKYICYAHSENKRRKPSIRLNMLSPFVIRYAIRGLINYGADFEKFSRDYEIHNWLKKYAEPASNLSKYTLNQFQASINNTVSACYMYVLFYSIMRRAEAMSLKEDCLSYERDERLGSVPIITGETTKTDPDSDARWIVSKKVEKAIKVAKTILEWKLDYIDSSNNDPHSLFQRIDVWNKGMNSSQMRKFVSADVLMTNAAKFFNIKQFVITQEDYLLALAMTPTLKNETWFKVGGIWKFGFHQFRRTLAIMFALNNVSSSTSQFQMKHGTREQQFRYMNNYTKLKINDASSQLVINEFYHQMAKNLTEIVTQVSGKFSPYGKTPGSTEIVNLLLNSDIQKLTIASKEGKIKFRKNLLGGCMNQEDCEYGGVDSINQCVNGSNGNMCSDLIIDSNKSQEFIQDMEDAKLKLQEAPVKSPLANALKAEIIGYEKVLILLKSKRDDH